MCDDAYTSRMQDAHELQCRISIGNSIGIGPTGTLSQQQHGVERRTVRLGYWCLTSLNISQMISDMNEGRFINATFYRLRGKNVFRARMHAVKSKVGVNQGDSYLR